MAIPRTDRGKLLKILDIIADSNFKGRYTAKRISEINQHKTRMETDAEIAAYTKLIADIKEVAEHE